MSFIYTQSFIDSGFTYAGYKKQVNDTLAQPPVDDNAAKLRPRMQENIKFMNFYDHEYVVSNSSKKAVAESPDSIWLVIAEGWCTDAAFNVPMMAAIERTLPKKISLRIFLRDSNLELIDANLTDGGRSIPKLIILNKELQELATWGPRPAGLQAKVQVWKEDGLTMKRIIPKIHAWYDTDASRSFQKELEWVLAALPVDN